MRPSIAAAAILACGLAGCATLPPTAGPVMPVAGTSWMVQSVNGMAAPATDAFFLSFDADRLSAKFGCNGMGGDYVQRGNVIDPGVIVATRMACPDMRFETQAGAILNSDLAMSWDGSDRLSLSNSAGSIVLLRRF